MKKQIWLIFSLILIFMTGETGFSQDQDEKEIKDEKGLVVLWTTGEKEVFTKMLYIYTINAKKQGWFDDITMIVWGPSAKLLAEDKELQNLIKKLAKAGVKLEACSWCTEQYGVTEDLKKLGIDVRGMGKSLTDYIKDENMEVLVF
jgi:hypothetical protein